MSRRETDYPRIARLGSAITSLKFHNGLFFYQSEFSMWRVDTDVQKSGNCGAVWAQRGALEHQLSTPTNSSHIYILL